MVHHIWLYRNEVRVWSQGSPVVAFGVFSVSEFIHETPTQTIRDDLCDYTCYASEINFSWRSDPLWTPPPSRASALAFLSCHHDPVASSIQYRRSTDPGPSAPACDCPHRTPSRSATRQTSPSPAAPVASSAPSHHTSAWRIFLRPRSTVSHSLSHRLCGCRRKLTVYWFPSSVYWFPICDSRHQ